MTLTKQDFDVLSAWFPASDHEFRDGRGGTKLTYLTEEAITPRIIEVDPAFELTEPIEMNDKQGNITIKIGLTIKGVTRWGIGTAAEKSNTGEPSKDAVTDAYKRAARLFGIGLYLKYLKGSNVTDEPSLQKWFDSQRAANLWTNDSGQMEWLRYKGTELRESVQDDELVNAATKTMKMADYPSALDYFYALTEKVREMQSSKPETVTTIANQVNGDIANNDNPPNVTKADFQKTTGENYGKSTIQVFTKSNADDTKRYMTISGVPLWSREPLRVLGFDDSVIEQLAEIGEHVLPHSVTPCYVMDGTYKKLIRIRRDDTGMVVDADGQVVNQAS